VSDFARNVAKGAALTLALIAAALCLAMAQIVIVSAMQNGGPVTQAIVAIGGTCLFGGLVYATWRAKP